MNRTMQEITINKKLSLVEFRDEKTQELDLSRKGYKDAEAIIIGALLQVLFSSLSVSCCLYALFHHPLLPPPQSTHSLPSVLIPLTFCHLYSPPGNQLSNHSPAPSVRPLVLLYRSTTR